MQNLISFAQGKKTYAIVAISIALGVIQGLHDYHYIAWDVPNWAMFILGFAGIGSVRSGIKSQAAATTENMLALFAQTVAQLQAAPVQTPAGTNEKAVTAALNKAQQ